VKLNAGDYAIGDEIPIERKSYRDLEVSIVDGRLRLGRQEGHRHACLLSKKRVPIPRRLSRHSPPTMLGAEADVRQGFEHRSDLCLTRRRCKESANASSTSFAATVIRNATMWVRRAPIAAEGPTASQVTDATLAHSAPQSTGRPARPGAGSHFEAGNTIPAQPRTFVGETEALPRVPRATCGSKADVGRGARGPATA